MRYKCFHAYLRLLPLMERYSFTITFSNTLKKDHAGAHKTLLHQENFHLVVCLRQITFNPSMRRDMLQLNSDKTTLLRRDMLLLTSDKTTLLNFVCRFLALSWQWAKIGTSIDGVLILSEATIRISTNRGIPKVTFISPRPAKWKVFKVICVEGSPIDWKTDQRNEVNKCTIL